MRIRHALVVAALVLSAAAAAVPGLAATSTATDRLLVKFHPGTTPQQAAAALSEAGGAALSTIDALDVHVVSAPEHAASALARNPHVEFVEEDAIAHALAVTPNDPYWSQQWGTVKATTNAAWSTTTGASSVVIAELDTGVDFAHPDLQGAFVAGWDFVGNDNNPTDDHGHGTNVAGVLAARGNNGIGVAGQCWKCSIMPIKVLDASGSGSYSAIASGITWAADHGARIINMSLGGSSGSSTLANAVNYAWNKGVLVIAAAGNNGTTALNYPAAYDPAVAVAASDTKDGRYSWSSYGSWVEVAAPGCDITTARGGSYSTPCGTSFASPMVAGIAGLLASAHPGATNASLRTALLSTADPVGTYVSSGRVDAAGALAALGSSPTTSPSTTATFAGNLTKQQSSRSYSFSTAGGAFSASLSFSRASSLTLTVRRADGTTVAQAGGPSVLQVGGTLAAGTYTVTVSGTERTSFDLSVTYPPA